MKLPKSIHSALGAVPVVVTPGLAEDREALGMWDMRRRRVLIEPDQADDAMMHTLMHECVHVAMTDSGIDHLFTPEIREVVADAMGAWMAGAVRLGFLKIGNGR